MASSSPDFSDLVIMADSNIQDPKPATLEELLGRGYTMLRVTTMDGFRSFDPVPGSLRYLVIACLSPMIAELSSIESADDRELALGEVSLEMIRLVTSWLDVHPKLHLIFVTPLCRFVPTSFKEDSSAFMASIMMFCDNEPRAQLLRGFSVTRASLQKDGSTLLQAPMVRYVEGVFSVVRSILEARKSAQTPVKSYPVDGSTINSINWDDSMGNVNPVSSTPLNPSSKPSVIVEGELQVEKPCYGASLTGVQLVDPEVVTVRDLAVAMNSFYVDFLERCIRENREFARLQESECYRENCKQNDKVIINGYQGASYSAVQSERNALFLPMVTTTIKQVLNREVEFSVHGRNGDVRRQILPPVEVRFMGGAEIAEEFRREGAKMSKERRPGVSHLFFNSCTTLATRVRIEILRSMGTRLTNGSRLAYCVATQSKPYLSVGPANAAMISSSNRRRSYRFVEAVETFGHVMDASMFDRAYERAGPHFAGRLEMLFLVLTEKGSTDYFERRTETNNNVAATSQVSQKRPSASASAGPAPKR